MLVLDGKKYFNQREKSVEIRPGDIILYDQASPFEVKISENYRAVAVTMPRDLIDKHQIDVNSFVCRPISSNNYFGKLIKNLFYKSMNHDISMHNNIDHRINNLLLDIIELNFITQDDYDENGGPSKSLNDAKSIMSMNISDPDFNVSDICKSLKVSARTLNRWFAGDGTTPMRWLREQRLAGSHRALVEGRASNVTAAAMNFGFNDLSHYSHIFKERYGYPPSALIRQPRGRSD